MNQMKLNFEVVVKRQFEADVFFSVLFVEKWELRFLSIRFSGLYQP